MGDYENLDYIVGRMKRAAIDCWMADQSFDPWWANRGYYAKWGFLRNMYERPDENGEGGGVEKDSMADSIAPQFDVIRADVDSVVSKWRDLPDGAASDDPRHSAGTAGAELGSSTAIETLRNNGELERSNNTIERHVLNNIRGSFREPFHDKYYSQFSLIATGLGDACVFLEINYAAQSEIWPAVRTDVAQICEEARGAWADRAETSAQATRELVLTVAGALAAAASSIVTAGVGTVAVVATLSAAGVIASTALKESERKATVSGDSYGKILDSLSDALGALNGVIKEQEETLAEMLNSATESLSAAPGDFNLDAFELGDYDYDDGTMNVDRTEANIISNAMGRVESVLASAVSSLGQAPESNPTPRKTGIGRTITGTHIPARSLHQLVSRYLTDTHAEYMRGHGLFNATVEYYFDTDTESKQAVEELLAEEALNAGQTA